MPRVRNEFPQYRRSDVRRMFRELPVVVGNIAVNFFKDRFRQGGWIDTTFQPWAARKRQDRNKRSRAILVKTGRLRRSIRVVSSSFSSVTIGSDVPYAKIHNEGGRISGSQKVRAHTRKGRPVRAHTRTVSFTIPQRRFMGPSPFLTKRIIAQVEAALKRIYQKT